MTDDGWYPGDMPQGRSPDPKDKFTVIRGGKDLEEQLIAVRKEIAEFCSGHRQENHTVGAMVSLIDRAVEVKVPDSEIQDLIEFGIKVGISTRRNLETFFSRARLKYGIKQQAPQENVAIITWANSHLMDAVVEAEKLLVKLRAPFFDYGGKLIRLEDKGIEVRLRLVTPDIMYEAMLRHIKWECWDADRGCAVAKKPPRDIASMMLARNDVWPYPRLNGVTQTPLFRIETNEVISGHGYDEQTGIYIASDINVIDVGSPQDALNGLRWLLRETAYDGPESESSTLAGIMTVVLRASLPVVPGWVVIAHEASSGKSALQEVAGILATGNKPYVLAYGNPDEFEKRLNAALLEGRSIIMVDNFNGVVRGELLAQAVSQENLGLRILGKSELVSVANRHSIMINGNNSEIEGEQRRRYTVSYLMLRDSPFSFDIFRTAKQFRDQLVSCILKIVSSYRTTDRVCRMDALSGFGDWSAVVRESLVWLGLPDPLATGKRVVEEDTSEQNIVVMLAELHKWAADTFKEQRYSGQNIIYPGEFVVKEIIDALNAQTLPKELKDVVRSVSEVSGFVSDRKLGAYFSRTLNGVKRYGRRLERRSANGRSWYRIEISS